MLLVLKEFGVEITFMELKHMDSVKQVSCEPIHQRL